MKCPKCRFENREGAKFCKDCGTELRSSCPECGYNSTPDSKSCDECGFFVADREGIGMSMLMGINR